MALQPLFNRVVIKSLPKKDKISVGGIIVTATGYDKTEEIHGEVVAVGADCTIVKAGDIVSFPSYGYDTVSANDGSSDHYMSVREQDILAIITN